RSHTSTKPSPPVSRVTPCRSSRRVEAPWRQPHETRRHDAALDIEPWLAAVTANAINTARREDLRRLSITRFATFSTAPTSISDASFHARLPPAFVRDHHDAHGRGASPLARPDGYRR